MELQILTRIKQLTNTYTGQPIDVDDYVKQVTYDKEQDKVLITLAKLGDDANINRNLEREIIKICKIELGIKGVKVSYLPEENSEPVSTINPTAKVIAVMSGKGGVGKSNVAVNLANELAKAGKKVGLIDADIYGYSIPLIAGSIAEPKILDGKIMPVTNENGVETISAQHFLPDTDNKAIIWRGVKLNSLLTHFVYDVLWMKNLDFMIIDMPPGTGDVLLNINNLFETIHGLYVTTPSSDAAYVAERVIQVAHDLNWNDIGLVENMAYYQVDGQKHYIFGRDGAKTLSEKYNLDIIETIPIGQELSQYYSELGQKVINHFN